jgi:HPt (histidine-containing phosphotransfer) domain-containing protein
MPEGLLDQPTLDAIRGLQRTGATHLLDRVIAIYLEDAPRLVQAAMQGLQQRDAEELRLAVHSLKSSSASLGATRLAAVCKAIEVKARAHQLDDLEPQMADLEREFRRVQQALEAERLRSTG